MKWFYKLPDWVQHGLFGAAIMGVMSLVTWNVWLGWVAGVFFYYGREHRDSEIINPNLYDRVKGLFFWNWSGDSITDLLAPVAVCSIIAAAVKLI